MTASGTESYTTAYTYDANNRLTTEAKTQSGTTTTSVFTYDNNGNLLTELDATNTAVVTHGYDALNRLTSSTIGNAAITYTYNPRGIRTSRTVGATTTQYLLDGGNVVGETTEDTTTTYLRGLNLVSDGTNYYLYNAHGDVSMLANAIGTVTKSYSYDAFGNQLNTIANDANPFRYCGEYFDSETGNYYLRARYYDPGVGRFTQQDTYRGEITNPHSLNYYTYCYNNPVLYHDPSGHFPFFSPLNRVAFDFASYMFRYATRTGDLDRFLYVTLGAERKGETYHIRQDWWQSWSFVGYNRVYDFVFDVATDMEAARFKFTSENTDFIIWAWKGDYINLGAGAELGIYYGGGPHWKTGTDYALPMTLQLLDESGATLVSWAPNEANWWITGFNPQKQFVDASTLTAIYTIDFSSAPEMFVSFYTSWYMVDSRWTFDTKNLIATLTF